MLTGRALHLAAHYNNNYKLIAEQELRSYGKTGDRFSVGGWASAYMKKHNPAKGIYCCIDVLFPGSSGWISGGMAVFNYEEGSWQFACGSVTAPCDYNKLLVRVNMTGQMNYADVTGLFLYPEAFGTDFVYDAKGNPQESRKLYGATENAEYDDCNNLIRHTAPGHTKSSTFSYGRVPSATTHKNYAALNSAKILQFRLQIQEKVRKRDLSLFARFKHSNAIPITQKDVSGRCAMIRPRP